GAPLCGLLDGRPPPGHSLTDGQSLVRTLQKTECVLGELPIGACSLQRVESLRPLRCTIVWHLPRERLTPAGYLSASWQLRPGFHSSWSVAPMIPLALGTTVHSRQRSPPD